MIPGRRRLGLSLRLGFVVGALLLAGCTTIRDARGGPGQRLDPWEKWNRKVFNFNEDLDRTVLKPVATGYSEVVPQQVRRGVSNFFSNFADAWSAINNMLQGKFELGFEDATRVGANTLFGLFGILDPASEMGLDHHYEDFGQTLGRYGVGAGAYVVLPLLGPVDRARRRGDAGEPARDAAGVLRRHRHADRPHRAADRQHPIEPARRHPRDRRHLARQVHVRSRCIPAASASPGVRRRPAGGSGGPRRSGLRRGRRRGGQRRPARIRDGGLGARLGTALRLAAAACEPVRPFVR